MSEALKQPSTLDRAGHHATRAWWGRSYPVLPGVPLIFLAQPWSTLTWGGSRKLAAGSSPCSGFFAVLALAADYVATSYGARRFGASWAGTLGGGMSEVSSARWSACCLSASGPSFGLILGTIGGVFLGEYLRRRNRRHHRQRWTKNPSEGEGSVSGRLATGFPGRRRRFSGLPVLVYCPVDPGHCKRRRLPAGARSTKPYWRRRYSPLRGADLSRSSPTPGLARRRTGRSRVPSAAWTS